MLHQTKLQNYSKKVPRICIIVFLLMAKPLSQVGEDHRNLSLKLYNHVVELLYQEIKHLVHLLTISISMALFPLSPLKVDSFYKDAVLFRQTASTTWKQPYEWVSVYMELITIRTFTWILISMFVKWWVKPLNIYVQKHLTLISEEFCQHWSLKIFINTDLWKFCCFFKFNSISV